MPVTCVQTASKMAPHAVYMRYMQFTCKNVASILRRTHAKCLQPHVNLLEHNGYLTGNFTCGTHANSPAIGMQIACFRMGRYMQFSGKSNRNRWQKDPQLQAKIPTIAGKNTHNCKKILTLAVTNTRNCRQYCYHTAGKFTCKLQVS